MKRMVFFIIVAFFLGIASFTPANAGNLDNGYAMLNLGQFQQAANFFCGYARAGKNVPESLALCGRLLDKISDSLTGSAEKKCYWNKKGSYECMQREASILNSRFGHSSFTFNHNLLSIVYTGAQYRIIISKFPHSRYRPEADFYLLLKSLRGHPTIVLPRIKAFISKYSSGVWHRKGLLLWARVNEDIWYVHKKWSWVLYNYTLAPDELVIRAEPYRQEALKAYRELKKYHNTFEGITAAIEYLKLKANQDDGVLYSIVNDSYPGTLMDKWKVGNIQVHRTTRINRTPYRRAPRNSYPSTKPERTYRQILPQRWGN